MKVYYLHLDWKKNAWEVETEEDRKERRVKGRVERRPSVRKER